MPEEEAIRALTISHTACVPGQEHGTARAAPRRQLGDCAQTFQRKLQHVSSSPTAAATSQLLMVAA